MEAIKINFLAYKFFIDLATLQMHGQLIDIFKLRVVNGILDGLYDSRGYEGSVFLRIHVGK